MVKFLISVAVIVILPFVSAAQCAMCRTQVKNNVSNGDVDLAAGLNTGILYLMITPYIALGVIGFLWYRNSRNKIDGRSQLQERLKKLRS